MKREIKFRAWDVKEKQMLEVNHLFNLDNEQPIEVWTNDYEGGYRFNPDKSEIMQYTGLKDMNGVEIYEGDVVNVSWPLSKLKGINHAIGYSEVKDGHPVSEAIDWYEDVSRLIQTHDNGGQITVVGNCFENPELLEAEK